MTQGKMGSLYSRLKADFYSLLRYDYDLPQILKYCAKYSGKERKSCKLLDVGCGYGKKLKPLQDAGYDALGVEINPTLVAANQKNGLNCMTVEAFEATEGQFDLMLMSHIIEHFTPTDLKAFMDDYLDRLKVGGHLIIATPLMSSTFYDDFDHVKPYYPQGIMMVFVENYDEQVQYVSRNKLQLKNIWFRRRHYRPQFVEGRYLRTSTTKWWQTLEFLSVLACRASGGKIGTKDGWIGVFKKVKYVDD